MKKAFLLSLFLFVILISKAQQTFLYPDTLRSKNTPLLTDSSDKIPNTQWIKQQHYTTDSAFGGNYIYNQKAAAQTADYWITSAYTNSTSGGVAGFTDNNYTWSSAVTASSGSAYGGSYNNMTHNFNLGSGQTLTISNGVLASASFNRLVLSSSASTGSTIELEGGGSGNIVPRAMSALSSQVYLPSFSGSDTTKVSDVASLVVKSVYQDASTTNSVKAVNYYQVLIEPSDENVTLSSSLMNKYGVYQAGVSDTNIFKGPLVYANKYSNSNTPSATTGAGSGSSASVTISGTNDGGVLTVATGSSPLTAATIATVTFSSGFAFPNGCSVVLFPASRNAAGLSSAQAVYITGSTSNWIITSGSTALSASTSYIWNYQVIGY